MKPARYWCLVLLLFFPAIDLAAREAMFDRQGRSRPLDEFIGKGKWLVVIAWLLAAGRVGRRTHRSARAHRTRSLHRTHKVRLAQTARSAKMRKPGEEDCPVASAGFKPVGRQ